MLNEIANHPSELSELAQPPSLPGGYHVEESGQSLKITFVDRSWITIVSAIIIGGIILGSSFAAKSEGPANSSFLIPLLIGIAILYWGFVKLLNHYEIIVTSNTLSIHSVPLPTFGGKSLDSTQIAQLSINRIDEDNGPDTYQLHVKLKDGSTTKLMGGLIHYDGVKFLEQQIKHRLGIQSQAVADKTSRTKKSRRKG